MEFYKLRLPNKNISITHSCYLLLVLCKPKAYKNFLTQYQISSMPDYYESGTNILQETKALSRLGEPTKNYQVDMAAIQFCCSTDPNSITNSKTKNIRQFIQFWAQKHITDVATLKKKQFSSMCKGTYL
jgi:hypothetical protein